MSTLFGFNAAAAVAGSALGIRLDPYAPFNFLVEISGLLTGGFSEVRGLEGSVDVHEHAEGGVNGYVHQLPGKARYPNLVLSHGLTAVDTLWSWYDDVCSGVIKRRSITIMLLDRQRLPIMWWDVRDALPVKWIGPTLDATADTEVAVESVELVHKGITKPAASRALAMARAAADVIK